VTATAAYLQGYLVYPDSRIKYLGKVPPNQRTEVVFVMQNLTSKPITVQAVETSCSCVTMSELPMTIGPYECRNLIFHQPM